MQQEQNSGSPSGTDMHPLELALSHIAVAMVLIDSGRNISYISPYTWLLAGELGTSDSLEDPLRSILSEQMREQYDRAITVGLHGETYEFDTPIIRSDGAERWIRCFVNPILSDHYQVLYVAVVATDITRLKRTQQHLDAKNQELQDITYMVSHDLKSPIATIKGMLGILAEDSERGDEELRESIALVTGHCRKALARLDLLIRSVIDFAQVNTQPPVDPVASDIMTHLNDIAAELAPAFYDVNGLLKIEVDEPIQVMVGARELYQILANLIGNAVKYRSPDRPLEVTVRIEADAQSVWISVADNGLGIPENRLDSVFRPFHRVHTTVAEGSGVGLAIVKKLVTSLGGTISVTSTVNVGSIFRVHLQRAAS
jgi:two-component system CheB/CheR fusion protein